MNIVCLHPLNYQGWIVFVLRTRAVLQGTEAVRFTKDRRYVLQGTDSTFKKVQAVHFYKRRRVRFTRDRQYVLQETDSTLYKRQIVRFTRDRQYFLQETDSTFYKK